MFSKKRNIWHTSQLNQFVTKCDELGGIQHPDCAPFIENFELKYDAYVDQRTDPSSDKYISMQVGLYEEIAQRKLDQITGEQSEVPNNINKANPYGSDDVAFISKHARCILNIAMLANLKPNASILDMGCGWGLSTELLGFTGAKIHAVDINPDFIDLVNSRCSKRNISLRTSVAEFSEFKSNEKYDLIVFYECLHHSVSVVDTLGHLSNFAKDDGKIIFAGEPVTTAWWPSWGIRLDPLSIYCIKKFGWFETGWSENYIKKAFEKIGWHLSLIAGIGLDHGYIGYAAPVSCPNIDMMDNLSKVIPAHWSSIV